MSTMWSRRTMKHRKGNQRRISLTGKLDLW